MNWIGYVIVGFSVLVGAVQLAAWIHARRSIGRPAPETSAIDGEAARESRRVYYFHARHCGPCRAMAPLVERLRQSNRNLVSVDIEQHVALARSFAIAGTPSFVLVERGKIKQVLLGGQSEKTLQALLQSS